MIFPLCLYSPLGGELYSGTVSDFSGTDALIYRNPLRTEQYAPQHLNGKQSISNPFFHQKCQTLYLCNGAHPHLLHCDIADAQYLKITQKVSHIFLCSKLDVFRCKVNI